MHIRYTNNNNKKSHTYMLLPVMRRLKYLFTSNGNDYNAYIFLKRNEIKIERVNYGE